MTVPLPSLAPLGFSGEKHWVYYLLRHGETEWNVQQRPQGRLDSPLTELGWQQAVRSAEQLSGIAFVRAYTSPLGRAHLSAERVLAGRSVALSVLDDLAELDWGEVAGLNAAEREIRFPELKAARQADKFGAAFPGGESYASARPRAERAAQQICGDGPGPVLVMGHEMINRLLRMELCGLSVEDAIHLAHPHGAVYVIQNGEETLFCKATFC